VRNRFPPPASLKQPEDVLQEEWYKILLETVQNLYESISRRTAEGKRWSNTMLINKCVQCSHYFVPPLYVDKAENNVKNKAVFTVVSLKHRNVTHV
jgi:hypothetical protein